MRTFRLVAAMLVLAVGPGMARASDAQTLKLTVHTGGTALTPIVTSGAVGACHPLTGNCLFYVNTGATVRLAVPPGRFTAGTGPAAACTLSTCSFVMTGDAEVTVTGTNGAPTATLTITRSGDGGGAIVADGVRCTSASCTLTYVQGSSVELLADAGATARFTGYSAGSGPASVCGATPDCSFTLNSDASVTGTFLAFTSFSVSPSSAVGVPGGAPQPFVATGTYTGGVTGTIPPGRGAWAPAPALPFFSVSPAAAALGGRVYAMGGYSGTVQPEFATNQLAAFDPGAQTWTNLAPMLVKREWLAAATADGRLYAIGGSDTNILSASMERYDPGTNTWTMRASMAAPRQGLVAGTVDGIIYAAGGVGSGGPVGTLEAYNPATDTWIPRASMPTPRSFVTGGVVDGILYVVGGSDGTVPLPTVEAYDPATNTWTTKAPLPVPLSAVGGTVADGVLYVIVGRHYDQSAVFAYDPIADAWTAKNGMSFPRGAAGAASLNGIVYAIGGDSATRLFCCNGATNAVETFVDSLRWSSSQPGVARIDQSGSAMPLSPGTATIVANVGGNICGANCGSFSVVGPSTVALNGPLNGSSVTAPFNVIGWALNTSVPSGTGVDLVHVHAYPGGVGPAIFLGAATYGLARPDVGAAFGSQFTNSGFSLPDVVLTPGPYTLVVYAHNALLDTFDAYTIATITVTPPVSQPFIDLDTPREGYVVTSAFEVGGWALDAGSPTGTGVDAVHFYVFPDNGNAPGVFIGQGSYGLSRPDVGAIFGARFTNSGFHYTISGLGPGAFVLGVYARSTVTGGFSIVKLIHLTVNATALMALNPPEPEAIITAPVFDVDGWSIDRSIESTALSGSGVDTLHVYAYPNPGSGAPPIFLGVATVGLFRPDVGALYGARYDTSGYHLAVDRSALGLTPGVYNIVVHSHSTVSNTFNNLAVIRVTLQ